jgi:hypothetical protein
MPDRIVRRDEPDWLLAGGWQNIDEQHPAGDGRPAYRIVFKTLRVVVKPAAIEFPNLRLMTGQGTVSRGGMRLGPAVQARRPDHWMLQEFGRLVPEGDVWRYQPDPPLNYEFRAFEEEVADVFWLEMIIHTDADKPAEQLVEGRERLATLKTMLDLRFGPRLLGLVLTEETGRVFDDWHFNRWAGSQLVGNEWQLDVYAVTAEELVDWNNTDLSRFMARPLEKKLRLRLATDWYWSAIHDGDPVRQYIALWFVVEVLLMPDSTNIRPIREFLAQHVGGAESDWANFVGRHFGRRSRIVHGEDERQVEASDLTSLRELVEAILQIELSTISAERAKRLRDHASLS